MEKKKISDLTKSELEFLIETHTSINKILKSLSVNSNGSGAYRTLKAHCDKLGVIWPEYKNKGAFVFRETIPLMDILIENSTYQNRARLKQRLVREGILKYECYGEGCSVKGDWLGKKISLQLEHKNGINNDNRIENIQLLCPNCHSQTSTYSGKNLKK